MDGHDCGDALSPPQYGTDGVVTLPSSRHSVITPPPRYTDIVDLRSHERPSRKRSSHFGAQNPAEQVKEILGLKTAKGELDNETGSSNHDVFSELFELTATEGEEFWKEVGRWIKFEERVDTGGERWSKPHVSSLPLAAIFELKTYLDISSVILDVRAENMQQVAQFIVAKAGRSFDADQQLEVAACLSGIERKHHHYKTPMAAKAKKRKGSQIPGRPSIVPESDDEDLDRKGNNSDSGSYMEEDKLSRRNSLDSLGKRRSEVGPRLVEGVEGDVYKFNELLKKKVQKGAEACNILIGQAAFLKKEQKVVAFVRLNEPITDSNLSEVDLPLRFVFLFLTAKQIGNPSGLPSGIGIGRAVGTLLSDDVFREVAYRARTSRDIQAGIDEFLHQAVVLPPGSWDASTRIDPPAKIPTRDQRMAVVLAASTGQDENDENNNEMKNGFAEVDESSLRQKEWREMGLVRSGRLFGGLLDDIKRKSPFYLSDFKDGIAIQSLASFFFMYFACLTPIITFGGLMSEATNGNLGAMECLVAASICGVIYHLFAGQPLIIVGATGPILIFEAIIYVLCNKIEINFIAFRFWIGIYAFILLLIIVAFDLSALVVYITRFTEECFATLIALIFIKEAFKKLLDIIKTHPLHEHPVVEPNQDLVFPYDKQYLHCECLPPDPQKVDDNHTIHQWLTAEWVEPDLDDWRRTYTDPSLYQNVSLEYCLHHGGQVNNENCKYIPDVFLFSVHLFFGTFFLAYTMKFFKNRRFFPASVRQVISDFSVFIAVVTMVGIDAIVGLPTPKLHLPSIFQNGTLTFEPTSSKRGWLINPFGSYGFDPNPHWTIPAAILPALLITILIFLDHQITGVIVNRRENKFKKGCGYHLDLFIIAILVLLCTIMGLPFFVAATVLSMAHVSSLKMESEAQAPGEKPFFLGVRENRLTGVVVFVAVGFSVFLIPILQIIPMPVLYGVFLYMGVSALRENQFIDRILILFMPHKHQPDYAFLRHVKTRRVHLFTLFQVIAFVSLWIIKSFKQSSILFPLMVLALVGVRKLLDFVFSPYELDILDDIMPESKKREKEEQEAEGEEEEEEEAELRQIKIANARKYSSNAASKGFGEPMYPLLE